MNQVLFDKAALVTGGAQGLGQALCRRFAQDGAHVIVADLNLEGAERTAAEISSEFGRRTLAVKVDVTDEAQVEKMVNQVVEEFGRLDLLVSNAGILISGPLDEFPVEKWRGHRS